VSLRRALLKRACLHLAGASCMPSLAVLVEVGCREGLSLFPFRVLGPTRAAPASSPWQTPPLMQFTRPSESCQSARYRRIG
jgi:hypothetical protein